MARALAALAMLLASVVARAGDGGVAPPFTLRDIDGRRVSLSDFRGKVVLIDFWATWCAPCQLELPRLQQMREEYGPRGFEVVAISTDDARSASRVKPLVKRNGYTFPVLLDRETQVVAQYNPSKTLPYAVLLDREHRIRAIHQGYRPGDEDALRTEIEALLEGRDPGAEAGDR